MSTENKIEAGQYAIIRHDAELRARTSQAGHFCVRRNGKNVAMFLFDYTGNIYPFYGDDVAAFADAKAFIVFNDLVAALKAIRDEASDTLGRTGECIADMATAALIKAGAA